MKIRLLVTLLALITIPSSCVRKVDSLTPFVVEGRVYDKESSRPLENVKVIFIDTGYDDVVRSKKSYPIQIGQSDSHGRIECNLEYFWGRNESIFHKPPKKTFEIVLSSDSHMPKRFHFNESELRNHQPTVFVDLKKIYLVPRDETKH